MKKIFLILLFFSSQIIESSSYKEAIIWNIGQGQWVTIKSFTHCYHLDMGGDRDQTQRVAKECQHLKNELFLSHSDMDHMNQIQKFAKYVFHFCRRGLPSLIPSKKKKQALESIPECTDSPSEITKIYSGATSFTGKSLNPNSRVFESVSAKLLAQGDSPSAQEKIWKENLHDCPRWLVLGHHGSRTSTSEGLLAKLPCLHGAIASARWVKYGHPHPDVIARLRKYHVPLLKTEDWGTIRIRL